MRLSLWLSMVLSLLLAPGGRPIGSSGNPTGRVGGDGDSLPAPHLPSRSPSRLHLDDGGAGKTPVIFVHGLAGDHTLWEAQLSHVRLTRRAVAYDLRGHGRSRGQEYDDFSISAHARDLAELADGTNLDRFVLVGHSLGASIAGLYAAERADRVAGLLLVDPSGDHSRLPRSEVAAILRQMSPEKYPRFMRRYFSQLLRGGAPAVRAHVLRVMRHAEREAVAGTLASSLNYNPLPALERYPGHKLSVVTEFNEGPTSLHELLPDLPSCLVRGVSHWLMMDRAEEFNRLMDDFLRGIGSPAAAR